MKTYLIGCTHFGDEKILSYLDDNGKQLRPFKSLTEMENTLINNYNSTVEDQDLCYFVGDIAENLEGLELISELNGTKILIAGNHDTQKTSTYLRYFKQVRGAVVLPQHKIIVQHYPIHSECLYEGWTTIHAHTHHKSVEDPRYFSVCPEVNNYHPVDLEDIIKTFKKNAPNYI